MSAEVIRFPSEGQGRQVQPQQGVVATALAVHEIIVACLAAGHDTMRERAGLLLARLVMTYGELAPLAEGHFELVYGCDPITFLHTPAATKPSSDL